MNKGFKLLLFVMAFGLMLLSRQPAKAQCAVCSANVASNVKDGGKSANGLNHGIMYLLFAPYLAVGVGGFVWYKKFRKNDNIRASNEKLHLN